MDAIRNEEVTVLMGDMNAKVRKCCSRDIFLFRSIRMLQCSQVDGNVPASYGANRQDTICNAVASCIWLPSQTNCLCVATSAWSVAYSMKQDCQGRVLCDIWLECLRDNSRVFIHRCIAAVGSLVTGL